MLTFLVYFLGASTLLFWLLFVLENKECKALQEQVLLLRKQRHDLLVRMSETKPNDTDT